MRKSLFTVVLSLLIAVAGSALAQGAAAEAYMVLEGQIHTNNLVGLVPEGIRMEVQLSGEFTEGLFAGATADWTNHLLIRRDGVRVMDVRGYAETPDGTRLVWTMKGYFGEPSPPPLEVRIEAMLDPEFQFPDVELMLHGAAWFETMAPEFGFVNHTVFSFTGAVNPRHGDTSVTFRPIVDPAP